jgi:hypothetical protein
VFPGLTRCALLAARPDLPPASSRAPTARRPFQSVEGLSLRGRSVGALRARSGEAARDLGSLPENIGGDIVEPAVQGVIYKSFARYTVREIFSTKRAEIQQAIETSSRPSSPPTALRCAAC